MDTGTRDVAGARIARDAPSTPAAAVVAALDTDAGTGLTRAEARRRLAAAGPNELEDEPARPWWRLVAAQFAGAMILVLVAAAAITLAVGETRDAAVIAAILVLNALIGTVQEHRAERAMAALRSLAAPTTRVLRDGAATTVEGREVVPGDVLELEAGDVVPADARLLDAPGLRVGEAPLTGESTPVDKLVDPLPGDGELPVAERSNMVFRGTFVVHGRARAVVVATGMDTALGEIAGLLRTHRTPPTPLQRRLSRLGRRLAVAALVLCTLVFALGLLRGEDPVVMFVTAVSLAVAAVPEALPAVVTIALALGAQRMARRHALMRRLPAVETLGSVTVICTDKTGTLTQGRMLVERLWTPDGEWTVTGSGYAPEGVLLRDDAPSTPAPGSATARLLTVAAGCNDARLVAPAAPDADWEVTGDPTEGALLALAAKAGHADAVPPRVGEVAFDATRRRMTTVHRSAPAAPAGAGAAAADGGPSGIVATKGAVEAVLAVATRIATPEGEVPLTPDRVDDVVARAEAYAAAGERVLALAGRAAGAAELTGAPAAADLERDLVLYGLVAMADPPRPEARAAVAACRRAGIRPVLITGDHPATAAAIAERLGIRADGEVMTGARLADEGAEGLARHVDRVTVYARTSPEQKLDIVRAWQARGELVAMTGDGVNDAPALRAADIGVAMGVTGTEVAKEAAEMVLTDDDFATIVAAVGEGRRIRDNVRRFIRYTLTSNTGEIWVMLLGPLFGLPLPLVAVQILWINLVTDGLPGLALGVEPAERDVMERPPRRPDEGVFADGLWQHILMVGLLMGLIPLGLGVWGAATGRPWQTLVFTSLALLQLGHALGVRSDRDSLRALGLGTNRALTATVIGTVALQLAVVYTAWGQALFHTSPLDGLELAAVLLASTGALLAVEAEKAVRRRTAGGPAATRDAPDAPVGHASTTGR